MKKIMKRLLTGVLTFATVFTALPVTQVHAADSVYTTTDGKAGTIVKIDNGGSEVSSFEESIMNADGQIAYCIDINTNFQSGYKNRINATERMSDDQISDVALNLEYVKQYAEKHSLSSKQVYLLSVSDEYPIEFTSFDVFGTEVRVYDEKLCEAIKKLSERRRNVVLMFYFLELPDAEIAEILDISRNSVYRNRMCSLKLIRDMYEEEL